MKSAVARDVVDPSADGDKSAKTLEAIPTQAPPDQWSAGYRHYILLTLTLVYAVNFADRQLLAILQESIKRDLGFSDTQLGVLSGIAFAALYTLLGFPLARLADKKNRRNLIAIALIAWSAMTAVCGLVSQFVHLLLARVGVGIGEAGCTPPAVSMISDLYPQKKRATPMAVYSLGMIVGMTIGYVFGGLLDEAFGWRVAFFAIGIPGVFIALLVRITVKEPRRGMADGIKPQADAVPLGMAIREMFGSKTFRHMAIGTAILGVGFNGVNNWCPPFYMRVHSMSSSEVGMAMGTLALLCGGPGTFLGGYLADKLGQRDSRWFMVLPAISGLLAAVFMISGFLVTSKTASLVLLAGMWLVGSAWYAPIIAMSQGLVSPRVRAMSMAMILFLLNLIGMGLGPVIVGWLSDLMTDAHGANGLRYALCIVATVCVWASWHLYVASKTVDRDLRGKTAA